MFAVHAKSRKRQTFIPSEHTRYAVLHLLLTLLACLQGCIPFAVVGSNSVLEVSGKKIRGRNYPWGVVEVDNIEHCDFATLRNMLLRCVCVCVCGGGGLADCTNNFYSSPAFLKGYVQYT